jgi:autotransporter-associated beta strand protein
MKTPPASLRYPASAAVLLAAVLASSSALHAQTWDGGGTTISWGTADNWDPNVLPVFNNTTDLIFNTTVKPNLNIGAVRTIRSITFGADIDSDFVTNFRSFDGGASAALTMQADSGNATLTVDSGASGNISFGYIGTGTVGGALILSSNLDIVHNGSGTLTMSRQITGASGFTKSGTGTMQVAQFNTNSFTGAANFNGGRAIFGNTNTAGGDLNAASAVNLGGGTLEIRTTTALNKTLTSNTTVSSASTLAYNNTTAATQTLTVSTGTLALNADLTVQNISANTTLGNGITISRNITGTGGLIVDTYNNIASTADNYGLGRVGLSGDNSAWSGNLNIARGTVSLQGSSLTGQQTGTGTLTVGTTDDAFGAGLTYFSSAANTTSFQVNNSLVVTAGGFRSIKGGNTDHGLIFSGDVLLNGDLNVDHVLSSTRTIAFTGNITGTGGVDVTRSGGSATSSVSLSGNNTYSGDTTIASGARLFIGVGGATGSITSAIVNDGTVIFNRSDALSYSGAISGAGVITKTGAGDLTLSGAVSSSGGTTVTAGSLIINGNFSSGTNNISVASAAALGGDGSIAGNISFAAGANYIFNTTATLNVSGAVTLDNSFGVANLVNADGSAVDWSIVSTGIYTLIDGAASVFGNISNFGEANAFDIGGGRIAYFQNGSLELVVGTPIPEPGTFGLLGGIAALGFAGLRRRRRSS